MIEVIFHLYFMPLHCLCLALGSVRTPPRPPKNKMKMVLMSAPPEQERGQAWAVGDRHVAHLLHFLHGRQRSAGSCSSMLVTPLGH